MEGGVHNVGRHANGEPSVALAVAAFDQHAGDGFSATGEDTHLVIHQCEVFDVRRVFAEVLAQRLIERIDGAIALAHGDQLLAIGIHLDGGFGDRDEFAHRIVAALDQHTETLDREKLRHLSQKATREKLKACASAIIGIAQKFTVFHLVQKALDAGILWVNIDAGLFKLDQNVGTT